MSAVHSQRSKRRQHRIRAPLQPKAWTKQHASYFLQKRHCALNNTTEARREACPGSGRGLQRVIPSHTGWPLGGCKIRPAEATRMTAQQPVAGPPPLPLPRARHQLAGCPASRRTCSLSASASRCGSTASPARIFPRLWNSSSCRAGEGEGGGSIRGGLSSGIVRSCTRSALQQCSALHPSKRGQEQPPGPLPTHCTCTLAMLSTKPRPPSPGPCSADLLL